MSESSGWPDADSPRVSALVWPLLLAFASGAAALVYQVLWIKQLSLVVGVEVEAIAAGVSAFFAGLALGGWCFGRLADRLVRPMRLVALLEAGVCVLAVAATWMLPRAAAPFASWHEHVGPLAWVLPFALVGVPAVLMGGTLPVLIRALNPAGAAISRVGARLYAANTAGAIGGTLAASFTLIPAYGLFGSGIAAGGLNLVAALLALVLSVRGSARLAPRFEAPVITLAESTRQTWQTPRETARVHPAAKALEGPHEPEAEFEDRYASTEAKADAAANPTHTFAATPFGPTIDAIPAAASTHAPQARLALALYAVAGGVALGYEVVWSQLIVQFISTRSFAFAMVLATYLFGLALGSAAASRFVDRSRDAWGTFAALIAAAGFVALLETALLGGWLAQLQSGVRDTVFNASGDVFTAMCAGFAAAALCVVFLPTLLLGAAFPFALRLNVMRAHTGRDVGAVLALNTAGGIAGTLLAGFVLVPLFGVVRALGVLAAVAALLGVIAVWRGSGVTRPARQGVAGLAALTLAAAFVTPSDTLAELLAASRGGKLSFYEESSGGTVAVVEQRAGRHVFQRLYIQGVSNSGDAMTSLRYMRLQALLPLIIHRDAPHSALVIGLGTGITGGALLTWPGLQQRVVAELLPAVVRAAPRFQGNYDIARDPRMDIRLRDGRRELLGDPQRYDVITLEPPPPSAAGVVNLYSTDFYRLAAARLAPGGIVAQWLPLSTQNEDDTRSLIQSFIAVFPHAALWTTELHEMMLVGSNEPLELDVPRIKARFAQPQVAAALQAVGVASPAALLGTYVTDRAGLAYYAADARPVTDDRPRIEYAPWVRSDAFPSTLGHLLALRTDPPLRGSDEAFHAALQASFGALQSFYAAGLDAYRGDREAWSQDIRSAMDAEPDNAYFRWVVGDGKPAR